MLACATPVTAAPPPILPASFENAVFVEINRARERPTEVAQALRRYRTTLRGRIAYAPGRDEGMVTKEGAVAVDEAIAYLDRQPSLAPLAPSTLLGRSARTLMAEQARTGSIGHRTQDGRSPGARVRAAGGGDHVGESIAYGYRDPTAVVHQLIVDDGVPGRGHRALIFERAFQFAGVGCASHPRFRHACTIDFAATADGRRSGIVRGTAYASR